MHVTAVGMPFVSFFCFFAIEAIRDDVVIYKELVMAFDKSGFRLGAPV
jgi:hypothetical protein